MENLLLIAIVLLGVPHGAADLWVSQKLHPKGNLVFVFGLYVLAAGLFMLGWWFWPHAVFLLFLLVSGWHFAETDLPGQPSWRKALYGVWLIMLLMGMHADELMVSANGFPALPQLQTSFFLSHASSLSYLLFLFGSGYFLSQARKPKRLFLPFAMLLLGLHTPFLIHFCLYFLGWHAPVALNQIRTFMGWTWTNFLGKLLPLSILSWVMFGTLGFMVDEGSRLFWFFGLLAALTLPHSFLFHWMTERTQAPQTTNEAV